MSFKNTPLTANQWRSLRLWLKKRGYTLTPENTDRFTDGCVAASVLHSIFPRLVDMHDFIPCKTKKNKVATWTNLNTNVLVWLRITLTKKQIEALVRGDLTTLSNLFYDIMLVENGDDSSTTDASHDNDEDDEEAPLPPAAPQRQGSATKLEKAIEGLKSQSLVRAKRTPTSYDSMFTTKNKLISKDSKQEAPASKSPSKKTLKKSPTTTAEATSLKPKLSGMRKSVISAKSPEAQSLNTGSSGKQSKGSKTPDSTKSSKPLEEVAKRRTKAFEDLWSYCRLKFWKGPENEGPNTPITQMSIKSDETSSSASDTDLQLDSEISPTSHSTTNMPTSPASPTSPTTTITTSTSTTDSLSASSSEASTNDKPKRGKPFDKTVSTVKHLQTIKNLDQYNVEPKATQLAKRKALKPAKTKIEKPKAVKKQPAAVPQSDDDDESNDSASVQSKASRMSNLSDIEVYIFSVYKSVLDQIKEKELRRSALELKISRLKSDILTKKTQLFSLNKQILRTILAKRAAGV